MGLRQSLRYDVVDLTQEVGPSVLPPEPQDDGGEVEVDFVPGPDDCDPPVGRDEAAAHGGVPACVECLRRVTPGCASGIHVDDLCGGEAREDLAAAR
ncbi:hypothetical protein ACFWWC_45885 [Streptomyces sp. NPDC058642]|uniref:hypothetical protein n=1 Tax=Streptomyces sp. NPDC058642 TaxID=3346572 RepID=UPI0036578214